MSEEFSYVLKVPQDRVGVLIGKSGEVKKQIETATKSKLAIDSKEGEITITAQDGLRLYEAREVVRAIARGFNPEIAMSLLKTDYALEILNIDDFSGKNKNTNLRLKGRVIGSEGKSRREIERLTQTTISVYGKTVGIIGEVQGVTDARHAIENLLQGATHASVYKFLEKRRRSHRMQDTRARLDLEPIEE